MLDKVPGDAWQKAATIRALFTFMFAHPGKKLLFMGMEFGQWNEWRHTTSLDWHLLGDHLHGGMKQCVSDLNHLYAHEAALYEVDYEASGFSWMDCNDAESSIISFMRRARDADDFIVTVLNWTPVVRGDYRIGVPAPGYYREMLNSDAGTYGGSNAGNGGGVEADAISAHCHPYSINLTLPPLAGLLFKRVQTS